MPSCCRPGTNVHKCLETCKIKVQSRDFTHGLNVGTVTQHVRATIGTRNNVIVIFFGILS